MRYLALLFLAAAAHAQTPPALNVDAPDAPPVVEAANALAGAALRDALRKGGYVLYVRHAETGTVTAECTASNLTPKGEEQARRLGAAWKRLGIPVAAVQSSELCRVRDTARLVDAGPVEVTEDLNIFVRREGFDQVAARRKRLAQVPPAGKNLVLVSHIHSPPDKSAAILLPIAGTIVFKPDGKGGAVPVARVTLEGWEALPK